MKRICKKCHLEKDEFRFELAKGSNGKFYRLWTCRVCRKAREKELNPSIKSKDRARLRAWKESKRGTIDGFIYSNLYRWRARSTVPSDLTFDYLKSLWDSQSGKCYYTNAPLTDYEIAYSRKQLTKTDRSAQSPSLDKLDPSKGYVQGNVAWCSYSVNSMKGDLTYEEFLAVCKHILKVRDYLTRCIPFMESHI